MNKYLPQEKQKEFLDLKQRIDAALEQKKPWQHQSTIIELPKDFDFSGLVYRAILDEFAKYNIGVERSSYKTQLVLYQRKV